MFAYKKERLENAICFFVKEHKRWRKKDPTQTYIYKYLALFDFGMLIKTGRPVLDLEYMAMERGPVPIEIYSQRDNYETKLFKFVPQEKNSNVIIVKTKGKKPDLEYFSEVEIEEMKRIVEIYINTSIDTNILSGASHEVIVPWEKAWYGKKNSMIKMIDAFPNICDKKDEDLSPQEENFLIYSGLKKGMEIESRRCDPLEQLS
ncbi:MAG: DUF4065 domain-containing protein [Candidatus Atribacteria bacterium]|nr:DUF4065 domain-containing protein [Candidatus Atribacteria bacterium]